MPKSVISAFKAVSSFVSKFDMFGGLFNPLSFAISMVASSIISKIFAPSAPNQSNIAEQPNPGNPQQLAPAGDNKLPVIYGTAYVGGIITDLSISQNNQDIYWVISLCEVTNSESGGTPDNITFGNVYWGGKRVVFGSGAAVTGLDRKSTRLNSSH